MIVVDASVAVKWLVPEAGSEAANRLLEAKERLFAPAIARVETIGAVVRQFREGKLQADKANAAFQVFDSILESRTLTLIPVDELFDSALDMAMRAKHALADCLYLAAGLRLGVPVLTADEDLCKRGKRVYKDVTLLDMMTRLN